MLNIPKLWWLMFTTSPIWLWLIIIIHICQQNQINPCLATKKTYFHFHFCGYNKQQHIPILQWQWNEKYIIDSIWDFRTMYEKKRDHHPYTNFKTFLHLLLSCIIKVGFSTFLRILSMLFNAALAALLRAMSFLKGYSPLPAK